MKNNILIFFAGVICALVFLAGYWSYPRINPAPVPDVDTILIHDTTEHHIINDVHHYHSILDTVRLRDTIYPDIDTAKILERYFAYYQYSRSWNDSLVSINLSDIITENESVWDSISYKILRPQTVINTTNIEYNYTRYLYLGMSATFPELKYADLSLFYAFSGGYAGIGYYPFIKSVALKWGVTVKKFR